MYKPRGNVTRLGRRLLLVWVTSGASVQGTVTQSSKYLGFAKWLILQSIPVVEVCTNADRAGLNYIISLLRMRINALPREITAAGSAWMERCTEVHSSELL